MNKVLVALVFFLAGGFLFPQSPWKVIQLKIHPIFCMLTIIQLQFLEINVSSLIVLVPIP